MRTKLVIAAVATAAAVSAVGASAYTNSIDNTHDKVIGYSSTSITGAAFHVQPTFTYSADLGQITKIDVQLDNDTSASTLYVSRNGNSQAGDKVTCTSPNPAYTSGSPGYTTYSCAVTWDVHTTNSIAYALQ